LRATATTRRHSGGDLLARLAPGIFLVFWSSGFGVGKVGLEHAEPLTFLSLRFATIIVLFVPAALALRPPAPARPIDWLHIAVIGFLIQTVYFGCAYAGMNLGVSAGVAAVMASTQPLIVALAAPWITGERIGPLAWAGLVLGAAGAITVVAAGTSFGGALDLGVLLCAGSALGMAGATLYQRRFPATAHPVTVNLVHAAVGLLTIGPLALAVEDRRVDWTVDLGLALGWLVLANSVIAVSLLLFMVRRSEASRVSALFFLIPPVAALIGWMLLGETLTPLACLGMVLAAAGVALVSR
jgi:drug/metabolite transporter (DMT)-like permease